MMNLCYMLDECEGISKIATLTEEQIHISISIINEDRDRRGDLASHILRGQPEEWGRPFKDSQPTHSLTELWMSSFLPSLGLYLHKVIKKR